MSDVGSEPTSSDRAGLELPAYPYERLAPLRERAARLAGGAVDLSVGTPGDPPPPAVLAALADADSGGAARGYPPSAGTPALREALQQWAKGHLGADVPLDALGVCVGTKELVAALPRWLSLRWPGRDTVLYPAVAYPTYEMGARLAGLRALPVPLDEHWRLDLGAVAEEDAARALLLWVNTPGNPAGGLDDLAAAAEWGAGRGVLVASDECYAGFTWQGPLRTVLGRGGGPEGLEGVLAVHALSKTFNMAGLRVGWYAGDPDLVGWLVEARKHAGLMVPGPVQAAAVAALGDPGALDDQRCRYRERLAFTRGLLGALGVEVELPGGGFYLWAPAPGGDAWAWADLLASKGGLVVSPGDFYGSAGAGHARLAMVARLGRLELVAERLGIA